MTGIAFTNTLPEPRYRTNQILLNGSGVAAGDVDGDGWCDVYLCGLDSPNALFRNLGNWKFEDITQSAGVACPNMDASGAALADLDGDRDLDLLVNSVGQGTRIFFNDGKAHFAEAKGSPLNPNRGGTTLALADIDGDAFLDLYVANYRVSGLMDMPNAYFTFKNIGGQKVIATVNNRPVTDPEFADRFVVTPAGGIEEVGEPDVLYRNEGGTNFAPIPFTAGMFLNEHGKPIEKTPLEWGLAAMFRDMNQDGLPDLYVCNDFDSVDEIWLNQGKGRFKAAPRFAVRKNSLFSMAIDFADINRDGWDDFFVVDMLSRQRVHRLTTLGDRKPTVPVVGQFENRPQYMMNTLFLNRGNGTYAEIAQLSGVAASEWSWAVTFLDVDLDGWEDILIANGHERASRHMDYIEQLRVLRTSKKLSPAEILESRKIFPRLATANVAFRNRHDLTFEEMSHEWGFDFVGVSNGMALADLDNDGDQDVVVNNLNDAVGIYRNDSAASRIAVRLKGKAPNTHGIGARITVSGGPVPQSQEVQAGGRYLSSDDPMRVFAARTTTNEMTIEVTWRSGAKSAIKRANPNRIYEIDEVWSAVAERSGDTALASNAFNQTKAVSPLRSATALQSSLFQDVSETIGHSHQDEPFNDFERQPLMPNKLSQLGPGVAWFDMDGDAKDDLIIGSGRGGRLALYRNEGAAKFKKLDQRPFNEPVTRDQTSVIGWRTANGVQVLTALANYEDGLAEGSAVRAFRSGTPKSDEVLRAQASSPGPMCMADVDSDGDLDLFVGGRCVPGKYPQPASSLILRNTDGKFEIDSINSKLLQSIGLVSGATWSDLDSDGDPDLLLACEWGPIKMFRNDAGKLLEITSAAGLQDHTGWWNGITTGDFDNDGRLDIVASNLGRNTRYERHRAQPLRLYYTDFDANGAVDVIEAHFDPQLNKTVSERGLDFLAKAIPFLREKFRTHEFYAQASIDEAFTAASQLEAKWLESTVFLNRGARFEARALPVEAQMAPAFGICVADFDGDANEDIFLSQNFFATQPDTPRYDGGVGLLLHGDGKGNFTAVPPHESGLSIYGEQRGCAASDFDEDGRVDLAVSQNGAATKLYRNASGKPGIRVRLKGSAQNPLAIGAVIRLGDTGPAREVQAGSGYCSQNTAVQVLASSGTATKIQVLWPGGKRTESDLSAGVREVTVDVTGTLQSRP